MCAPAGPTLTCWLSLRAKEARVSSVCSKICSHSAGAYGFEADKDKCANYYNKSRMREARVLRTSVGGVEQGREREREHLHE